MWEKKSSKIITRNWEREATSTVRIKKKKKSISSVWSKEYIITHSIFLLFRREIKRRKRRENIYIGIHFIHSSAYHSLCMISNIYIYIVVGLTHNYFCTLWCFVLYMRRTKEARVSPFISSIWWSLLIFLIFFLLFSLFFCYVI